MDRDQNFGLSIFTENQHTGAMFPSAFASGASANPNPTAIGTQGVAPNVSTLSSRRQRVPEPLRPDMGHMMASNTREYKGWIKSADDFRRVEEQYLKVHDRERQDCPDFPSEADEQRKLVKALFEAAQDCSHTYEPESSQSFKRVRNGKHSDIEFELVLWPLLMSTRDAQAGKCNLPNYLWCGEPQYNAFESFKGRFEAVREALKSSKDIVASLFKDATFKHRLAWRPRAELSQKATNRKLNSERDTQNAIGLRVASENGIRKDQRGVLVDRDGRTYGVAKKQSAAFEDRISKVKKRNRESRRAEFANRIAAGMNEAASPADNPNTRNQPIAPAARAVGEAQGHLAPLMGTAGGSAGGGLLDPLAFNMEGMFDEEPAPLTGSDFSFGSSFGGGMPKSSMPNGSSLFPLTPLSAGFDGMMGFNMGYDTPQPQGTMGQPNQFQGLPSPFEFDAVGFSSNRPGQSVPGEQQHAFAPVQPNASVPGQPPTSGQSDYPDFGLMGNVNWGFGGSNA
ncbi:hypothetical protein GGS26DRAFT_603767 [Hypomontagnella submonticulosa]|nr:hypothetical protein GGS26DRAFT_603767 [Hypomontagnella submonticulosa]